CVVHGIPPEKEQILHGWLMKDEEKNKVFIHAAPGPGAKEIRTKYRVLQSGKGLSLLEVELLTGRTHQIRAHLASIGCPLLGDGKYGTRTQNKEKGGYKRQFLCSYKLIFDFSTDAGMLTYLDGRSFTLPSVWFAEQFPDF
ncbi:MAG TPA: RNA pseudouridine synthase, partial [Clostridiales bacterium]|nr:RNA pseudouridine synthase [Clostridiales bacterium]